MATTKEQILNQQDAPEVAPPADAQPNQHANGGTAPTDNDGKEPPVNNGSAVVGAPATVPGGAVTPPSSPANGNDGTAGSAVPTFDWNTGTMKGNEQQPITVPYEPGKEPKDAEPVTKKAPLSTPAGAQPPEAAPPAKAPERKMSYVEMFQKMSPYKPPTEEELEKERKREKREKIFAAIGDGISALSNLYFTTHGAPNAFDPKNSLSAKAQERWEKLKKERDENGRYYTAAYMQAMKNDEEGARDDRNWRHQLEREGVQDQRYADDIAHRDKREGIEDERYDANIKHRDAREAVEDQRWDKQFKESIRQFNVTSAQNQQRINMEAKRLAREVQKDNVTFALGAGKGTISIPTNALNASNVSYVFSKLPAYVRNQCKGEPIMGKVPVMEERTDPKTGKKTQAPSKTKTTTGVVGYKKPTTEAMLICIGANIDGSIDAQNALREIGGGKPKQKKIGLK